jgi:hypothetical protein
MSFIGNISGYGNPNGKHINEHINQSMGNINIGVYSSETSISV